MAQTHSIFLEEHDQATGFTLERELALVTDDTSGTITAPFWGGYPLDKAFTRGGRNVEAFVIWLAKTAEVDPDAVILTIAQHMTREMTSEMECPHCHRTWTPTPPLPPTSPSVDAMYTWPIELAFWQPRCPGCGELAPVDWRTTFGDTKRLQKLVNNTKSSNPVIGLIAINYVAFLSAVLPGTRGAVFEELGARGVLHEISESLDIDLRYLDPLLASSRSALVLFEDTKLFELKEQYIQQESRISDPYIPDDDPLMKMQTQLHHDILNYFLDPHMKIIAISVVIKHASYFVKPDLSCARWTQHPRTNMLALLWIKAVYSPDPALSTMAATLLEHGYHIRVPNNVMMDLAIQCWVTHRNPQQHLRRLLHRIRERAREVAIQSRLPPSTADLWQSAFLRHYAANVGNPEFRFTGASSRRWRFLNNTTLDSEALRILDNNNGTSSRSALTGIEDDNEPSLPSSSLHYSLSTELLQPLPAPHAEKPHTKRRVRRSQLSFVTGTSSTCSNNTGAGRIQDRIIGILKPRVERLINGRPAHIHTFGILESTASFVTGSGSTESNRTGAGRVMDNAIGRVLRWLSRTDGAAQLR